MGSKGEVNVASPPRAVFSGITLCINNRFAYVSSVSTRRIDSPIEILVIAALLHATICYVVHYQYICGLLTSKILQEVEGSLLQVCKVILHSEVAGAEILYIFTAVQLAFSFTQPYSIPPAAFAPHVNMGQPSAEMQSVPDFMNTIWTSCSPESEISPMPQSRNQSLAEIAVIAPTKVFGYYNLIE